MAAIPLDGNQRSLGSVRLLIEPNTGDPNLRNFRIQERVASGSDGWRDMELDSPALSDPADVLEVMASPAGQAAIAGTEALWLGGVAGEQPRPLQSRTADRVSVLDFGAKGDGVTDDTTAIQAAIDKMGSFGGVVHFPRPPVKYLVSDHNTDGYCLKISRVVSLVGDGPYSAITPAAGVTVPVIGIVPALTSLLDLLLIEGLFIGDPSAGTRLGAEGIYIDTSVAGANLVQPTFRRLYVSKTAAGHAALRHVNVSAANVNGGMYGAIIEQCRFRGGIALIKSGDSLHILQNIISGPGIGIDCDVTGGTGTANARCIEIIGNNITSDGGAMRLPNGQDVYILHNNIEQTVVLAASNDQAVINVSGTNLGAEKHNGLVIRNNSIGIIGTGVTAAIRVRNTIGAEVAGNAIRTSYPTTYLDVDASNTDALLGPNIFPSSGTFVTDAGAGSMGTVRDVTSFGTDVIVRGSATHGVPAYTKTRDGYVRLNGQIKSAAVAAWAAGLVLTTLPVGYRPAKIETFSCAGFTSALVQIRVDVEPGGNVVLQTAMTTGTWLSLAGIAFPADKAGRITTDL